MWHCIIAWIVCIDSSFNRDEDSEQDLIDAVRACMFDFKRVAKKLSSKYERKSADQRAAMAASEFGTERSTSSSLIVSGRGELRKKKSYLAGPLAFMILSPVYPATVLAPWHPSLLDCIPQQLLLLTSSSSAEPPLARFGL